jgi:Zn-dependent M16 (insulinase) family peptidase
MRKQFKTRLLHLTRQDVLRAAEQYFNDHAVRGAVAVISAEEKLKAANEKLADRALELHRI